MLRIVYWNLTLLVTGLALIAGVGEGWLRLTVPFAVPFLPVRFVPGVGLMLPPDTEIRYTRYFDFWTVSRTNSLGFLDREPIGPARAAESCHVTMIGDSFVAAREVPVADKFHVRLEEMAARELPRLDVTTSAFGRAATGQFNQLPFYDEFARSLRPRLLVLVFVANDFLNNYPPSAFAMSGFDPAHFPYMSARRSEDGNIRLLPPDPDFRNFQRVEWRPSQSWPRAFISRVRTASYLNQWLAARAWAVSPPPGEIRDSLVEGAHDEEWIERWGKWMRFRTDTRLLSALFMQENDSLSYREVLSFTAFGLDEFRKRAARDDVSLVIMSTHSLGTRGDVLFDHLRSLAAARNIPVIDQYGYIRRQGGLVREAHWAHDYHWNEQGHQWAAESLLEYIRKNQGVCGNDDDAPVGLRTGPEGG